MNEWLDICKKWMNARYQEQLGISFNNTGKLRWHQVKRDDFYTPSTTDCVGVVQDAELGMLLILAPIAPESTSLATTVSDDVSLALRLRSELLPKYTGSQQPDPLHDTKGPWRVCLHWLVPNALKQQWVTGVMQQRSRSGAFDEISVDAIFIDGDKRDITVSLESHGIPRFAKRFSEKRQKDIATALEKIVSEYGPSRAAPQHSVTPSILNSLSVRNFRSIDSVKLAHTPGRPDGENTKIWVVWGPNGAGKSSLAEAVALKACGTSRRYDDFLRDRDETVAKNAKGYIDRYLTPYNEDGANEVFCSINDQDGKLSESQLATSEDDSHVLLIDAEGTMSGQEQTGEFAKLTTDQLYSRVAGSYSDLARRVQDYLEQGYQNANDRRKENNERFGLAPTAKRRETISARIITTQIQQALPMPASGTMSFLQHAGSLGGTLGPETQSVIARWQKVARPDDQLGRTLTKLRDIGADDERTLALEIEPKVREYAVVIEDTRSIFQNFDNWRRDHEAELPELAQRAREWSTWLAGRMPGTAFLDPTERSSAKKRADITAKMSQFRESRTKIEDLRKMVQGRLDHLGTTLSFVTRQWDRAHPNTCPTCDTDLTSRGGARKVIEGLQIPLESELAALRKQLDSIVEEMNRSQAHLVAQGNAECPVSELDRKRINERLTQFVGESVSAEQLLASPDSRQHVVWLLEFAARPSASPPDKPKPSNDVARQIAANVVAEWRRSDQIAEEPEAWDTVRTALQKLVTDVVVTRLPDTIGKLWWEIASALTSAPWLLPEERPRFTADLYRGTTRVHIRIGKDRLVRHFLNNAEQHILGLAWVFTRHVLHGRFRHAWLLLDDPAQEMDQPTFRDLARFLATLVRLYQYIGGRFTLAIFLHQEERSLDAARELDCGLYLLGWTPRQRDVDIKDTTVQSMSIYGPGFHSFTPEKWFSRADKAKEKML